MMPLIPNYSTRTLFLILLFAAMLLGWLNTARHAHRQSRDLIRRNAYAEQELRRKTDELNTLRQSRRPDKSRSFWQAELEGTNLAAISISSNSNIFQRASLVSCDLTNSSLNGGVSAFQECRFDNANLTDATLTGGSASFQNASFVKSNLTRAKLKGGTTSFQGATFEDAILRDAVLSGSSGSFQNVNLSGTSFEGADLSAIHAGDLQSCYFKVPPTYDTSTKFPNGFNPQDESWQMQSQVK